MFGRKKRELEEQVAKLRELRESDAREMSQLRSAYGRVESSLKTGSVMTNWEDPLVALGLAREAARIGRERHDLKARQGAHERSVADLQAAHRQVVEGLKKRVVVLEEQRTLFTAAAMGHLDHNFDAPADLPGFVFDAVMRIIHDHGGAEAKQEVEAAKRARDESDEARMEAFEENITLEERLEQALALLFHVITGPQEVPGRHYTMALEDSRKRPLVVEVDRLTGAVRFGFEHLDVP